MCIIAAKPREVAMPSAEIIRNMWENNPDGAGIMYAANGRVYIEKGFMTLEAFNSALERIATCNDMTKTPVVMHFRITTHGGTKPENCHPFPITDSVGKLKKLKQTASIGVAHNGIIHSVTPRKDISDTMEYIATQLAPLSKALPKFYKNKHALEMVANATESKLAFLDQAGEIVTIGKFEEEDGILYSNSSYAYTYSWRNYSCTTWDKKTGKWSTKVPGCYSGYDYLDDYPTDTTDTTGVTSSTPYAIDIDKKLLMLVDPDKGEFVIDDNGDFLDCDYDTMVAIDRDGYVYDFDWNEDLFCRVTGLRAYNSEGMTLRFNEDRAEYEYIMLE